MKKVLIFSALLIGSMTLPAVADLPPQTIKSLDTLEAKISEMEDYIMGNSNKGMHPASMDRVSPKLRSEFIDKFMMFKGDLFMFVAAAKAEGNK